jgi:pimeloyl-ACP methyl ester carboxylesterase
VRGDNVQEDRFFFDSDGGNVYAVLHKPLTAPRTRANRLGVVLCHPLLDFDLYEVPWTLRMIVGYARELARAGYHVLRFDFRGAGQSDGEFEDFTLSSGLADLRRAVDLLVERTGVREPVVIGTRLAGTIAMRAAATDSRIRQLGLWDPVPNPNGSLQAVFRRIRASQLAMGQAADGPPAASAGAGDGPGVGLSQMDANQRRLDAGGYVIGAPFREELPGWDTTPDVEAYRGRVLIVQILRGWSGGAGLRRELIRLHEAYRQAGAESELVEALDVHPSEWYRQPEYARVWTETSRWLALEPAAVS